MKQTHYYKLFLIIGLLFTVLNTVVAQIQSELIIISDNVGPLIDSTEREKYCLFPEYSDEDFRKAQFFKLPDGKTEVIVYLKNNESEKIIITEETFTEYQKQIHKRIIKYDKIDTSYVYTILLIDETTLYGKFKEIKEKEIIFETNYLDTYTIPKIKILRVEKKMSVSDSKEKRWFANPHDTRHFFAPTARSLQKGEGYFQDIYVFLGALNYGITDNITIGGGLSFIPFISFNKQIFFVNPKAGYQIKNKFNLGGGIFYASVPGDSEAGNNRDNVGIIYGVGTYGSKENNVTLGAGYTAYDGKFMDYPIVILGGMYRISRRMALVTENWLLTFDFEKTHWHEKFIWDEEYGGLHTEYDETYEQIYNSPNAVISYGLRFFSEKLCVDLGFFNAVGEFVDNEFNEGKKSKFYFPGIPYLDFVVKF